ncbi:MAG: heavy metal translocating P-type ATPase [Chloroflexota bacterium]
MLRTLNYKRKRRIWSRQPRQKQSSFIKALQKQETMPTNPWRSAIAALTGQRRQQQLGQLATPAVSPEIRAAERQVNQLLTIGLGSLAAFAIGNLGPPIFLTIGAVGVVYLHLPVVKQCYLDLVQERKVNPLIVYPLLLVGTIVGGLWIESGIGITVYLLAGKLLSRTRYQSRLSLSSIVGAQPRFAWVLVDGVEIRLPFDQIETGDVIVIGAGQTIPIDGLIVEGNASIDQQALTGEGQPAEKGSGDEVLATTTVLAGKIFVRVTQTGNETVAAKIGEILQHSADFELTAVSRVEKLVNETLLPTLGLGAIAFPVTGVGGTMGALLAHPGYNLRILHPLSMLNFLQIFSERGVLVKDGRSLETLSKIDTIIFDKTGTLTLEQPHVADVHPFGQFTAKEILTYAAAAQDRQTHPIAKAILTEATAQYLTPPPLDSASYEVGYGLKVTINGDTLCVGSDRFMTLEGIELSSTVRTLQEQCQAQGYSLVMVALNQALIGAIEIHPTIRPEAKAVVEQLKARGLDLYILSGDQEKPTKRLAHELDINHAFANTLPETKALRVAQLQKQGKTVCFVGDGINDAVALREADVSISLRGATHAATDTAQIVFMDGNLSQLPDLLTLGQKFEANMDMNLVLAMASGGAMVGGIFLFNLSFLAVTGIMSAGLAAGVVNTMLPLWRPALLEEAEQTEADQPIKRLEAG